MTKLKWTAERTYFDTENSFQATGPGVYDIPEDHVEKYLGHENWERPGDGDVPDDGNTPEPEESADDVEEEPAEEPDTIDEEDTPDADETGDEAGDELEPVIDSPSDVASAQWREAKEAIESGAFDDDLDAVEETEKSRENGPRDSILGAIEDRREA